MSPLLQVDNLIKRFVADEPPVLNDVSFSVDQGDIFVLLGPSGCGKTTLLRIIAGFEHLNHGDVQFDGKTIEAKGTSTPPEKRGIGVVFQDYALFPHLTVLQNAMYGLKGIGRQQRKRKAIEALEVVNMADMQSRRPHELSGGQQQRVAIARTIAPEPKMVLLDEPFSNLDPAMRAAARSEIRKVLHDTGMTALLVTHDQDEALSFADRIAVMNQGAIEQIGEPQDVYRQPSTCFVADFLGRTNLVDVTADGLRADSILGPLTLDRKTTGHARVSIRPEHFEMVILANDRPSATIISREFKGHDQTYQVQLGDKVLTVQTDHRCSFEPGAQVRLVPREDAIVLECCDLED